MQNATGTEAPCKCGHDKSEHWDSYCFGCEHIDGGANRYHVFEATTRPTTARIEHKTNTLETSTRYEVSYAVRCSCGWRKFGFEYRLQADKAGREHARRAA